MRIPQDVLDKIEEAKDLLNNASEDTYTAFTMLDNICRGYTRLEREVVWELYQVLPDGYHKNVMKDWYDQNFGSQTIPKDAGS